MKFAWPFAKKHIPYSSRERAGSLKVGDTYFIAYIISHMPDIGDFIRRSQRLAKKLSGMSPVKGYY